MKKNILLALLSGALLASAWVTYGFTALIFTALIPLLLMEAPYQTQGVCTLLSSIPHLEYPHYLVDMVFYPNRSCFRYFGKYATDDSYFFPLSYCCQTYESQGVAHLLSSDMAFVWEISPHLGCFLALAQFGQRFLWASYVDTMVRIYGDFWRYTMGVDCEYHLIFSYWKLSYD